MASEPVYRRLFTRLAAIDDGTILRTAFFAMLLGTLSVLVVDYLELSSADASMFDTPVVPRLPDLGPAEPGLHTPTLTGDPSVLNGPLAISLGTGGVMTLTGTIDPDAATRFAAEIEARGEYVSRIRLNSPGGSVADALAMSRLIRERGFSTEVLSGEYCASSCPLVLAGGVERFVDEGASVGVHQIFEAAPESVTTPARRDTGLAVSNAQRVTAEISRHLADMGVDPALWFFALETPPAQLYYLSGEEMLTYRLATAVNP